MKSHITKDTGNKGKGGFLLFYRMQGIRRDHVPRNHERNHTRDSENQLEITSQMVESVKDKEHCVLRDKCGV